MTILRPKMLKFYNTFSKNDHPGTKNVQLLHIFNKSMNKNNKQTAKNQKQCKVYSKLCASRSLVVRFFLEAISTVKNHGFWKKKGKKDFQSPDNFLLNPDTWGFIFWHVIYFFAFLMFLHEFSWCLWILHRFAQKSYRIAQNRTS